MQVAGLITGVTQPGEPDLTTIAGRLKWARENVARLSQPDLAANAGVAQGTIGNIESGARKSPRELLAIARAAGVHAEWLKSGRGPRLLAEQAAPTTFSDLHPLEVNLVTVFRGLGENDRISLLTILNDAVRRADVLALLGDKGSDWEPVTFAREFKEQSPKVRAAWKRSITESQHADISEPQETMFSPTIKRPKAAKAAGARGRK